MVKLTKIKLIEGSNSFSVHSTDEDKNYLGEIALEVSRGGQAYRGSRYLFQSKLISIVEIEEVLKFMKRKQKEFDECYNGEGEQ